MNFSLSEICPRFYHMMTTHHTAENRPVTMRGSTRLGQEILLLTVLLLEEIEDRKQLPEENITAN
jgi:hypothetical protein